MVDALGTERLEGLPDVGCRALLPRVGARPEALAPRACVHVSKPGRRMAELRGVEAHGHDPVQMGQRLLERRVGLLDAAVAEEAEDEARIDAELALRLEQGLVEAGDDAGG